MGLYCIVRIVATLAAEYDLHVIPEDILGDFTEICMKVA